ncbi:unnamed protein product [Acanthoscelides obtectus]|uniref:Uncharacterized protein n=1 Tax=Acanthoscelides obtectus TaxID=200917 RepID=A0A9P0JV70_ACAOB|nr:unnamed protein product [Acanthoscelides obtectus]CAK1647936.1 hypothetical protein AOBTE_LOCUS15463 [Acanthoscelides obtectus]
MVQSTARGEQGSRHVLFIVYAADSRVYLLKELEAVPAGTLNNFLR